MTNTASDFRAEMEELNASIVEQAKKASQEPVIDLADWHYWFLKNSNLGFSEDAERD